MSMILYLIGVKVNCCTSRADLRPWYHSTMVPVIGEIVAISDKTVHFGHTICTKIVKTLPWPLRETSGNSSTCLLLILGSYAYLLK